MTFDRIDLDPRGPISIRFLSPDRSYHRETRTPGADLTDLPADVRQRIEAHWTPALVASWQADQDALFAPQPITLADYSNTIDAMLDVKAQERQYDSIRTAVTYRDDPNPQFAAEGQALFEWRSIIWTYATAEMAKVQAGERAQPSVADFMVEIDAECPFAWPAA